MSKQIRTNIIIGLFAFFGLLCLYDIAQGTDPQDLRINQLNAEIEAAKSTWNYHNGITQELNFQIGELVKRRDLHQSEKKKAEDLAAANRQQIELLRPAAPKVESSPDIQAKNTTQVETEGYDVAVLCQAIAKHETASCTKGVGPTHNNCIGIKRNHEFVKYETPEASMRDCEETWSRYYGRLPDLRLSRIWSGDDRSTDWHNNVITTYYNLISKK